MRVSEVMTEGVHTVSPTMPAAEAYELMRTRRVRHLVVKQGAEFVGILSDRDAGGRRGAAVREGRTVGDLMTQSVVTISHKATVREAANLMRGRTIGCLPVTKGSRLVGILTVSDLLDLLGRGIDRPARASGRPATHYRVPHRRKAGGTGVW